MFDDLNEFAVILTKTPTRETEAYVKNKPI